MPKQPFINRDVPPRRWSEETATAKTPAPSRTIPVHHRGKVYLVTLTAAGSPSSVARLRSPGGRHASIPDRELLWKRGGSFPDPALRQVVEQAVARFKAEKAW
jgi:hypothetical protein